MQATPTVSATFHLTHACNLRCTYCYTGEKIAVTMPEETAMNAVAFCVEQANQQGAEHLEVVFFGGEPLLELDLLCAIVDRTRELRGDLRVSFKASTNGLLLNDEALERLTRREVYVSLSLDGDPQVMAEQRPRVGGGDPSAALDRAITSLLNWNPCACVNCVVTPASAGRLDRSVRWIFDRGFAYVSIALDYAADWSCADLKALEGSYERLAEWYVERMLAGERFHFAPFEDRIRTHTLGPVEPAERCYFGRKQFSIAPSGRLYPCVQFVKEDDDPTWVIGHVDSGFDAAARSTAVGCAESDKEECGGCSLDERCSSWCACVNFQSTGHIDRASPVLCEYERFLFPIADAIGNRLWKRRSPEFIHKHYNPAYPVLDFLEHVLAKEGQRASI